MPTPALEFSYTLPALAASKGALDITAALSLHKRLDICASRLAPSTLGCVFVPLPFPLLSFAFRLSPPLFGRREQARVCFCSRRAENVVVFLKVFLPPPSVRWQLNTKRLHGGNVEETWKKVYYSTANSNSDTNLVSFTIWQQYSGVQNSLDSRFL